MKGELMPLKLNVGLSRKVGETNYGSRGASIHMELELDSALVSEPGKLQEKVRQVFGLIRTSLAEELNGSNGSGQAHGQANGNVTQPTNVQKSNGRPATQSQVKAINAIARNQRLDLARYLNETYGVQRPEELDLKTASKVIDHLKGNGQEGGH
jgi:hypothetical protein